MKCAEIDDDVLDEVIFGRSQDSDIHLHLMDCPQCSEYYRGYQRTVADIRAAFAPADPGLAVNRQEVRSALMKRVNEASLRAKEASRVFSRIMSESSPAIPQPERVQRIHQASRNLSLARDEAVKAHQQLNDFNLRGTVPEAFRSLAQ